MAKRARTLVWLLQVTRARIWRTAEWTPSAFAPLGHVPGSIWSLDIKNASSQADGFDRAVFLRAPVEWDPDHTRRIWKLSAPAYGLNDASAEYHGALQQHFATLSNSLLGQNCNSRPRVASACFLFPENVVGRSTLSPLTSTIFSGAVNLTSRPRCLALRIVVLGT